MSWFYTQNEERGDTLIEVLIAITILSVAVVTAQAVMSYGQSIALRSVERTSTQGLINSQFSYVRYAKDRAATGDDAMWDAIIARANTNAVVSETCDANPANQYPRTETGMFFINEEVALDPPSGNIEDSVQGYTFNGSPSRPRSPSDAPSPGDGIWLLARSGGGGSYYDFYAKACWTSLVGPQMDQATSVLRLYAQ